MQTVNDYFPPGDLVVLTGLPGVGKSTIARKIADGITASVIRSDAVRKELFNEPTYSREETETVYQELCDRAKTILQDGSNVVLDATFSDAKYRDMAEETAETADASITFVHVTCEPDVVRDRIAQRESDISDADVDIYEQSLETFDPVDRPHVTLDNSGDRPASVSPVVKQAG